VRLNAFDQRILDVQNSERAAVGAPPLHWNLQLAGDATAYAIFPSRDIPECLHR